MIAADYAQYVPVILTGFVAFLGTWAGSRFTHSNEHKQWLRNEKMAACTDLLSEVEQLTRAINNRPDSQRLAAGRKAAGELSLTKLTIVFPFEVVDAADRMQRALIDLTNLAVETSSIPVAERDAWIEEVEKAIAVLDSRHRRFTYEASRDLNSGRFYGSGVVAPLQMAVIRARLRASEAAS